VARREPQRCRGSVVAANLLLDRIAEDPANAAVFGSKVREHQRALAVLGEQVVGDAIALARRPVTVERDRALTV
jgi:hypothetical protein